MKTIENAHIVVIGAARSGVAAALLLKRHGAEVFVTDHGAIGEGMCERLEQENIDYESGGHTDRAREGEWAVVSPGVPTEVPIVQYYLDQGRDVFAELEVASWFNQSPMAAVTGSNGKTTVTNWMSHLWKVADKPAVTAGNIGTAFSDLVELTAPGKWAILEVSSFQLDHIDRFRPKISVLLNITPDHLDRYGNSFDAYAAAKFRIVENQQADDWLVYNYDDPTIRRHVESLQAAGRAPQLLAFSAEEEVENGAFVKNDEIIFTQNHNQEVLMSVNEVGLSGRHNLNNGLATALAARAAEIKDDAIRESLRTFEGVEHRLELVRELDGVRYINDSKATNVNAVWYALDSFNGPVVLILGGRDKGNDYSELIPLMRSKVHTLIALGEAEPKIKQQLGGVVPNYLTAESMNEAVRLGRKKAKRGEIVLLSPACASFDMFDSYEHRGEVFKKAVNEL